MNHNSLDHFFHGLSKVILIIPAAAIIIGFYFKVFGGSTLSVKQYAPQSSPTVSAGQQVVPTVSKINVDIDLKGPFRCEKTEKGAKVTVYIKDKQVYSEIVEDISKKFFLIKGDCLYAWKGQQGEKSCGVTQLLTLYETMSAFGVTDVSSLFGLIGQSGFSTASREAMMVDVINTCNKEDFASTVFTVPTNVTFKDNGNFSMDQLGDLQKLMP